MCFIATKSNCQKCSQMDHAEWKQVISPYLSLNHFCVFCASVESVPCTINIPASIILHMHSAFQVTTVRDTLQTYLRWNLQHIATKLSNQLQVNILILWVKINK
jgi:hypothetical protein